MEKNLSDGTSFHQSDKPIPCANGCGFFGTAATMNLCSKCYRDVKLKEEQAASIVKSMTSSSAGVTPAHVVVVDEVKGKAVEVVKEKEVAVAAVEKVKVKVKSRCGCCNKKVGIMGFKCRCGNMFCGSHRYPEEHMCEFDFKSAGREAIKKDNPIVIADKIERF